jgi:two-component system, NtrC family, nitrogen regulation sensor histidine kinase GlnL
MAPENLQINILDNLKTAILLIQTDLSVSYINDSAEALLEVSGRRVIGESIQALFSEEDSVDNLFTAIEHSSTFTKRETKLHLLNRQVITVDCAVTPIYTGNQVTSMIMELQPLDLLLRISREETMLAAQENSQTLVRGMAHEIKNPLGGLRGAAQLLAKQLPNDELKDYTNVIIEEADRLTNLVDRMLGSNTLFNFAEVNIHEILERVKSLIDAETGEKILIKRDYDPSTPEIIGDKEQLIQAVLNVVRNAMQALQCSEVDNPTITLKTRTQRQFTIGATRHRLVCRIDISDNGTGIPEELMNTLFLPMVSGRADGTGLGLSITQSIIQHHKGVVECTSRLGNTTFSLFIPIEQPNTNTQEQ